MTTPMTTATAAIDTTDTTDTADTADTADTIPVPAPTFPLETYTARSLLSGYQTYLMRARDIDRDTATRHMRETAEWVALQLGLATAAVIGWCDEDLLSRVTFD